MCCAYPALAVWPGCVTCPAAPATFRLDPRTLDRRRCRDRPTRCGQRKNSASLEEDILGHPRQVVTSRILVNVADERSGWFSTRQRSSICPQVSSVLDEIDSRAIHPGHARRGGSHRSRSLLDDRPTQQRPSDV